MINLNTHELLSAANIHDNEKETAVAVVHRLEGMSVAQAESFLHRLSECIKRSVVVKAFTGFAC